MKARELVKKGDYYLSIEMDEEAYVCYLEASLQGTDGGAFYKLGLMYLR